MEKNPFEQPNFSKITTEAQETQDKEKALKTAIIRTVVSISVLVLLIVIIFFSIKYTPNIFKSIGNIFSRKDKITLTVKPQPVTSGQPVTITISHRSKEPINGVYSFAYPCSETIRLNVPESQEGPTQTLPCNSVITMASSTPIVLIPHLLSTQKTTTDFVVNYTLPNASTTALTSTAKITINPVKNTTTPSPTATSSNPIFPTISFPVNTIPTSTTATSTPVIVSKQKVAVSRANLEVSIFTRGIINERTGLFQEKNNIYPGERAAVRLQVMNTGGTHSGSWNFAASLPSLQTPVFNSGQLKSLAPGYSAIYTLSFVFDPSVNNRFVIVTVDPQGRIVESRKSDNTVYMQF